jgi:hypothetical protein
MKQNQQIKKGIVAILLLILIFTSSMFAYSGISGKRNSKIEKKGNFASKMFRTKSSFRERFKRTRKTDLEAILKKQVTEPKIDSIVSASYDTSFQKMKNIIQYDAYGNISNFVREYYDEGAIIYAEGFNMEWRSDGKLKSFTSMKKLDGVWKNDRKETYAYDPSGNQISDVTENWDTVTSSWVYNRKYEYTFDANHNMLSKVYSRWSHDVWKNSYKYEWGYDANNNKTLEVYSKWNSSAWKNDKKHEWVYDGNNNKLSSVYSWWDDASSTWKYNDKYEWTYDANNNELSETYYKMVVVWEKFRKTTSTYDGNNNLISKNKFEWNNTDSKWDNTYWTLYSYDASNNRTFENRKKWDTATSSWIDQERTNWTYNANGKLLNELKEDYDGSAWGKKYESTIVYDANDHITEYIYKDDWNGGDWDDKERYKFRYNSSGECNGGSYETWYAGHWVSADNELFMPWVFTLDEDEEYDFAIELKWYFTMTMGYEYSVYYNGVTGIKENDLAKKSFVLEQNYPNPFNPSTKINYTIPNAEHVILKVYDILGNEIVTLVNKNQVAGNYNISFDASNLTSGIYFYQITAGDFTKVHKMMLLK